MLPHTVVGVGADRHAEHDQIAAAHVDRGDHATRIGSGLDFGGLARGEVRIGGAVDLGGHAQLELRRIAQLQHRAGGVVADVVDDDAGDAADATHARIAAVARGCGSTRAAGAHATGITGTRRRPCHRCRLPPPDARTSPAPPRCCSKRRRSAAAVGRRALPREAPVRRTRVLDAGLRPWNRPLPTRPDGVTTTAAKKERIPSTARARQRIRSLFMASNFPLASLRMAPRRFPWRLRNTYKCPLGCELLRPRHRYR